MELNHDEVKSCFIISTNGPFSFQWKIYNFPWFLPQKNPISSPEFFYKDNSYPWFLKLNPWNFSFLDTDKNGFAKLHLYSKSNDDVDFKFTITVVYNQGLLYKERGTSFSFSKLRPACLFAIPAPSLTSNDVLNITCTIEVFGLEVESHTKMVAILHSNLNNSESQSDEQSFSYQIINNSGKAERKEKEANSHLKQKKVDESTVKIADSVLQLTQSSGTENTPDDGPDPESLKQLLIDFKRMLTQTMNTDVTIRIEDITIKTHMAVLSSRSPVFRKMFEHSALETASGEIEVTDIRASVMKKLINYFYCGEKGRLQYEEACELYYAADKYEILCLREACMNDLVCLLDVNNACPLLSLAYRHSDDAFKQQIMNFISKNFNSIVNTESFVELTDKDTRLAALLMRYCAGALPK